MKPLHLLLACAGALGMSSWSAGAGDGHGHAHGRPAAADARVAVAFPAPMREHLLANMREHLQALADIQAALAAGDAERAGVLAEQRLGMSSLAAHGAHEAAKYMPPDMREVGSTMHQRASRFALEAQNAGVTGDIRPALAALASTTQACVACHAGFRMQ